MVAAADSVDWIVTATEVEAIMLEYSLIPDSGGAGEFRAAVNYI